MSPIPMIPTLPLPSQSSFNREQINQINDFFSSTAGIVTFSLIWLISVIGMIVLTAWILAKYEEENRNDPELARERARLGLMLVNLSLLEEKVNETQEDCEIGAPRPGQYSRLI